MQELIRSVQALPEQIGGRAAAVSTPSVTDTGPPGERPGFDEAQAGAAAVQTGDFTIALSKATAGLLDFTQAVRGAAGSLQSRGPGAPPVTAGGPGGGLLGGIGNLAGRAAEGFGELWSILKKLPAVLAEVHGAGGRGFLEIFALLKTGTPILAGIAFNAARFAQAARLLAPRPSAPPPAQMAALAMQLAGHLVPPPGGMAPAQMSNLATQLAIGLLPGGGPLARMANRLAGFVPSTGPPAAAAARLARQLAAQLPAGTPTGQVAAQLAGALNPPTPGPLGRQAAKLVGMVPGTGPPSPAALAAARRLAAQLPPGSPAGQAAGQLVGLLGQNAAAGTAVGGMEAVGAVAGMAAAAIAAAVALASLPPAIFGISRTILESNRRLAAYSGEIAYAFQARDIREMITDIRSARERGATTRFLAAATAQAYEDTRQVRDLWANLGNVTGTYGAGITSGVGRVFGLPASWLNDIVGSEGFSQWAYASAQASTRLAMMIGTGAVAAPLGPVGWAAWIAGWTWHPISTYVKTGDVGLSLQDLFGITPVGAGKQQVPWLTFIQTVKDYKPARPSPGWW